MPVPISDLQSSNPFEIIELFQLELKEGLHYATGNPGNVVTTYYWHDGTSAQASSDNVPSGLSSLSTGGSGYPNGDPAGSMQFNYATTAVTGSGSGLKVNITVTGGAVQSVAINTDFVGTGYQVNDEIAIDGNTAGAANAKFTITSLLTGNGQLRFNNQDYEMLPIKAEGFEYDGSQKEAARPKISIANVFGLVTSILSSVNTVSSGIDLTGAKVTRIRTLAKYIDPVNFANNINADVDQSQEFPREIYYIDRKSTETREFCEFELVSAFDLNGIQIPKRVALPSEFPGLGASYG
tara:strand:+ start:936 stop:1820 length:885 start_codon:yes stop_codon:yes gene_type:complete